MKHPAVEMRNITKKFDGKYANDGIDFSASWGRIHALIGENGAGKSTLMKILYGVYAPDNGSIAVDGKSVSIHSPHDAIQLGIGMVHQQFMLIQQFSAIENIILGNEPQKHGIIDIAKGIDTVKKICEQLDIDIDLNSHISEMPVSSMQKVEIIKMIYRGGKILILDEPTSILPPAETAALYKLLKQMASNGLCIILITHKLEDVIDNTDDVTVLRQAKLAALMQTSQTNSAELASLMVGSEKLSAPSSEYQRETTNSLKEILQIRDLSSKASTGYKQIDAVDMTIYSGEIVGIAGVDGNGQQQLLESIMGLRQSDGHIIFDGQDMADMSVDGRMDVGMSYVPENLNDAVIKDFNVKENAILGLHRDKGLYRHGLILDKEVELNAERIVRDYDISVSSLDMDVRYMSGGNIQKLMIGRAMTSNPKLLMMSQPTRGLDINTSLHVYDMLTDLVSKGSAVLMVSYDLDEILKICTRILVLYKGKIVKEFDRENANKDIIGAYMVGALR